MARVHIALVVTSALALRVPLRTPMRRIRQSPLRATNDYLASISAPEPVPSIKPKALDENSISGDTFLGAFYKFTRPHTIRGTMLAAFAGVVKAIGDAGGLAKCWSWGLVPRAFAGLIALLCGNAIDRLVENFFGMLAMGRSRAGGRQPLPPETRRCFNDTHFAQMRVVYFRDAVVGTQLLLSEHFVTA